MPFKRRKTREIKIGNKTIGGNSPILMQTMLDFPTKDYNRVIEETNKLSESGCDLIRYAIKDLEDAECLKKIIPKISIPVIADIHFNYKLAIKSIENGVSKIRINPGNIGTEENLKKVIQCASNYNVPIRVGINSGSLPKKYKHPSPEAMVETALDYIDIFKKYNFNNIIISLKSSDINTTVKSYKLLSDKCDLPFHAGITEAGIPEYGIIKSSAGLGILFYEGLVDTFRISLTAPPIEEIEVSKRLLKSLGFKINIPDLISCPTCGRCEIDLKSLANNVNKIISKYNKNIKVAVMGCIVNGPGEAKECDIGIAGGKKTGIIFIKGETVETVSQSELLNKFEFYFKELIKKGI